MEASFTFLVTDLNFKGEPWQQSESRWQEGWMCLLYLEVMEEKVGTSNALYLNCRPYWAKTKVGFALLLGPSCESQMLECILPGEEANSVPSENLLEAKIITFSLFHWAPKN